MLEDSYKDLTKEVASLTERVELLESFACHQTDLYIKALDDLDYTKKSLKLLQNWRDKFVNKG